MNLRNAENYSIGLDIGTGSVGWAVLDENGELYRFKGRNTWGSRLFESADTAASTRVARALRRRYGRRYRRIQDLRAFLYPDMKEVDPDFFIRMNQSSLWTDDKDFTDPFTLFNDAGYSEKEYYKEFPTIYHLRERLVESSEKADIRLVYLALHHMMKYRGNFLIQGNVSAASADASAAVDDFLDEFDDYCYRNDIVFEKNDVDKHALKAALEESADVRRIRQERFSDALGLAVDEKKRAKSIGDAALGYQVNYALLFDVEENSDAKFSFDKDDKVEKFETEILAEEDAPFFAVLKGLHDAFLLAGLLKGSKSLSESMVNLYADHHDDLQRLKRLVKKYFRDEVIEDGSGNTKNPTFNGMFRGSSYADGSYKKSQAKGYTAYVLGKQSADAFYKEVRMLFSSVAFDESDRPLWDKMLKKMDDGTFLRKQRTSQNGAIPHQLHLEEMHAIIENQKPYYQSLRDSGEYIEELLKFRLPYYVGPLGKESNPNRVKPFAWAVRAEGHESDPIKPWTFEEVIDKDASAEAFIRSLTGECSYYLGKNVIPKSSLLYSEFCVRQELNVCKQDADGEKFLRMDVKTAQAVFDDVFKNLKKVKTARVEEYLKSRFGGTHYRVEGTQKENEFASSLSSYIDFKNILGHDIASGEEYDMVETLITWITIFEDKEILTRKVKKTYGPIECGGSGVLDASQVKKICKLRYTGWSNLSREFLEELRVDYEGGRVCIMDILRDSDSAMPMNMMEILADERFGFRAVLEEKNREFLGNQQGSALEDIPGSPAIKRGINQSLKIVDEIVQITGKQPAKICVEMAREEVGKNKGSRTKSRARQLEEWYGAITKDIVVADNDSDLNKELRSSKDSLDKERLFLYFLQRGKCMYCGKPLSINNLSDYHVDHIVPQSLVKDDSIDNKVLVHRDCNESKLDVYPLDEAIRGRNFARWKALYEVGLLSKKKFDNLTRTTVSKKQVSGFINRQLVETRQISKHVVTLLQANYPDVTVESIKAELTSNLRHQYGFYKSRLLNDYHHAHDAYLACQISRFLQKRYPSIAKDLDYKTYTRYAAATKKMRQGTSGLIVNSFVKNGFDVETGEIFRDTWYGEEELARIRKCLNYKDCFVSRKVEKLTGEFWNQTVYSRREPSDKAIPLKKGMDPTKYGYYMSPNSAFYSIVEHVVETRGKKKKAISMVGIPVDASYRIETDADLLSYLERRYERPRILKACVCKYQKIEWDRGLYYLTSSCEMINARQLWLPIEYVQLLDAAGSNQRMSQIANPSEKANGLFEYLCEQIEQHYPRYKGVLQKLKSDAAITNFCAMDLLRKLAVISDLLAMLHCDAAYGLASLGLATALGRMTNINFGSAAESITYIDSSVTGLFERRYRIEL